MAKKKITVTAEHIKEGTPNSCTTCPIALALQARGFTAWVNCTDVEIMIADFQRTQYLAQLPERARDFIGEFDSGLFRDELEPFSFFLEVPNAK